MKTIKVTDEMYNSLMELSKELNTQDHRSTAMPYFFQVMDQEEHVVPEGFGGKQVWADGDGSLESNEDIKQYFVDNIFGDGYDTEEEAAKAFDKLDEDEIEEKLESMNFSKYYVENKPVYTNAFFTAKACKAHISANSHHYKEPVDYLSHSFRSPEMELVMTFLCELSGGKLHV